MGVVSGVGGGNFSPYGEITREQAAVILVRLFNAIHANLDTNLPAMLDLPYLPSVFTDYEQISPWAFNGVASAFGLNIMSGVGDRRFAPQSTFTRAIYIGGERLVVYCSTIRTNYFIPEFAPPAVEITWQNECRWPRRDSVSVIYSGDDDRIIEFLNEIFGYNLARQVQ